MNPGIVQLDIHNMNKYQAKIAIDSALRRTNGATYRLRIIHGFHRGTELREMIASDYAAHPKVLRIQHSANCGQTDLVLREL